LEKYRGISNFDIAPFAVVKTKVPLKGNEGAIGHAMLSDSRRIESTLDTIRKKKALLDGPLKLIQGGTAVIARYPVFTAFSPRIIPDIRSWWPDWSHNCCKTSLPLLGYGAESLSGGLDEQGNETFFYGLVEFVSKIDKLTEDLRLDEVAKRMSFQFVNKQKHPSMDSEVFAHSADAPPGIKLIDPVTVAISLPELNVDWELIATPREGWMGLSTLFIVAMSSVIGGMTISVISFLMMESKALTIVMAKAALVSKAQEFDTVVNQ